MDVSLLIRLIDQVSEPAQRVKKSLQSIGNTAGEMGREFSSAFKQGFNVENVEYAMQNAEARLSKAKSKLLGAMAMAVAVAAPIKSLGNFEEKLVDFGNVAGIFGDDLKAIESELRVIAPSVNKSATEMLSAFEYMVGKGLSPKVALAALKSVGMTATATKSSVEDMAASGFAVLDNLKVPANNIQLAFDAMAQAGKQGGFELKGMAQYFPSLTASARALKMEGVPAVAELSAALQIAMKGAGNESSAANNLQNFLSKMASKEVTANFKKMGIDLEAEFQNAADNGVSVFEHMIELIDEATNGGNQFKMQKLFGDQQVLSFLKPMLANLEEYKTIRDAALSADGINLEDFGRVIDPLNARLKQLGVQLDNLTTTAGPLLEISKDIVTSVSNVVASVSAFAAANPELSKSLVLVTAFLLVFGVVGRLVGWVIAAIRVPLTGLANLFLKFDGAGRNVAKGWRMIAGAGRIFTWVMRAIMVAGSGLLAFLGTITAPVWAIVAALTAAAFAIWKYWDRISAFVSGFFAPFAEILGKAKEKVTEVISAMVAKFEELTGIDLSGVGASIAKIFDFSDLIEGAKAAFDGLMDWFGSFFSQEKLTDGQKEQMYNVGEALGTAIFEGIKAGAQWIWEWFAQWPDWIAEKIGEIDLSSLIKWGEAPDWLKWIPGLGDNEASESKPNKSALDLVPFGNNEPLQGLAGLNMQEVKTTIAAEVIDKRPPNVTINAPITVNEASSAGATAIQIRNELNNSIGKARTGALHEGGQ